MAGSITTGLLAERASVPSDQDHLNTSTISLRRVMAFEVNLQHWSAKVGNLLQPPNFSEDCLYRRPEPFACGIGSN
jgi:hypothetical protein